jgi:2-polyprenyl-3-methyl-5-hydroxy-6-metoxy-1,4-benzoquinol methylase
MKYSTKDKEINDRFYGYFLRHNQDDGWGDNDKYGNFKLLTDIVNYSGKPLKGTSVLDVGCGTGDLYNYLIQRGVKDYQGIDIYHMSVEYAQMKYPEGNFITSDFLAFETEQSFDYVFSSGALAAVLETNNYEMMAAFIEKMWNLCNVGVAFNFLTREYPKEKDNELFLYDLDEVLKLCKQNAPDARIEYQQNHAGDDADFLQTHIYLLH